MKNLNDLKILDAVAQFGSVRKTADHLSLTPSALGRKVLTLEAHFGVELFERTSKGLRLNQAGEHLVVYARAQLAEHDRIRGEIKAIKKVTSGHVRICASQSVLESFLPLHLAEFQRKNNKVTVTINHSSSAMAIRDLQEFKSDIGLCLNMSDHADISELGRSDHMIFAVMSKSHPLSKCEKTSLAEISKHGLLLPPRGSGLRLMLDQQAAAEKVSLNPVVESNTYASIANACRGAGLISFGLSLNAPGNNENQSIVQLRIKNMDAAQIRIIKLRGRKLSPAAAKLSKFLAKKMRSEPKLSNREK